MGPSFLGGEWRNLAILTWFTEPARVQPFVPAGVEIDAWDGLALVSVVGVTFLHLRVLGVPAPGLQAFAQVNVRFYVRRRVGSEERHGVRFLAQMAPSRILSAGAQLTLHEPFLACDTRVDDVRMPLGRRSVEYGWRAEDWHHVRVVVDPPPRMEQGAGSLETFVLQRGWGYTPQPDGSTLEYRVEHPAWRVWPVLEVDLGARWAPPVLPQDVAALLARPPAFALFAEGSPARIHRPTRLDP